MSRSSDKEPVAKPAPTWLVFGRLLASQIAAQLLFGVEDHHPDRRNLPFQCARDLGVTHLFVVAQHERHLVFFWQPNQLFPDFEPFFLAQNLGEWRRSRIVGDFANVGSVHARIFLPFSSSQFIEGSPTDKRRCNSNSSVSQIQTDGQLGLLENLVATLGHSANLLHSRSPFSCASSASIIGSVSHPVETGLLIPSDKSGYRRSGFRAISIGVGRCASLN